MTKKTGDINVLLGAWIDEGKPILFTIKDGVVCIDSKLSKDDLTLAYSVFLDLADALQEIVLKKKSH